MAVYHLAEAIRSDPYYAPAYAMLGNTYRETGHLDEAARIYLAAVALRPNYADVHCHLASTYKDLGRATESIPHYRRALELQPWYPDALCNLVHTYISMADWTGCGSQLLTPHCSELLLVLAQ